MVNFEAWVRNVEFKFSSPSSLRGNCGEKLTKVFIWWNSQNNESQDIGTRYGIFLKIQSPLVASPSTRLPSSKIFLQPPVNSDIREERWNADSGYRHNIYWITFLICPCAFHDEGSVTALHRRGRKIPWTFTFWWNVHITLNWGLDCFLSLNLKG